MAACGGGGGKKASSSSSPSSDKDPNAVSAETASFDLAAGPPGRYLIGLFTNDQRGVSFGSVQLQFCFRGGTKVTEPCQLSAPATATFLPTPGTDVPPDKKAPEVISPSGPKGVYEAQAGFDTPGLWDAHVVATVDRYGFGIVHSGTLLTEAHQPKNCAQRIDFQCDEISARPHSRRDARDINIVGAIQRQPSQPIISIDRSIEARGP